MALTITKATVGGDSGAWGGITNTALDAIVTFVNGIASPVRVVKAVDTSRASTTTFTNDPELTAAVVANAVYEGRLRISYEADAAGDLSLGFNCSATGSTIFGLMPGISAASTNGVVSGQPGTTQNISGINSAFGALGGVGAGVTIRAEASFTLSTSATPGNLVFAWCQSVSNATPTIVKIGSDLLLTRIG